MAEPQPLVLVIEDDEPIRKFLRVALGGSGYAVIEAATGKDGLLQATQRPPELILLDLGLPDLDGLDLIRQLREWSKTPIIIVSARGKEQDKVVALDAGADDYLTKPFGMPELLARLRVWLRHSAGQGATDAVFTSRDLHVDLSRREVLLRGVRVHLTPNEYRILALLAKHAGKVLTHTQILKAVWGPDSRYETHYVRVYVNQLRQKLEHDPAQPEYILTEPGVGYRLQDE